MAVPRIVVLGGGFAGLEAVTHLDRELRGEADVLLVSDQNFMLFTPLLPQVASSSVNPRHIVQTIREIRGRRRYRFRRATVVAIEPEARRLRLAGDEEAGELREIVPYDVLIVALGSRSDYFGIAGAREYTWDFKTLEDAVVLRDHVIDLCEHADHYGLGPSVDAAQAAERRALLTFVIIGGGYTGIELVTELADFLFGYVARRYRGISAEDIRLLVLEAGTDILRGIGAKLEAHARRRLHVRGIEVRTGAPVTRCTREGVEISFAKGGTEVVRAATVVWTAGVRAHPLVETLPGPHDQIGRAIVNPHLQLEEHPEIFVIGDSGAATSAPQAPRVAPVAINQGELAGRNVAHMLRHEPLESYGFKDEGMLVSLGMDYAVVRIGGLKFSGYWAWLFWNAVHLYKLVGLKKQLQVAGDWMLGTIFRRDASIIRRPRRCPLCGPSAAQK